MLGIASRCFSSSRYRSRLTLMKSMTLSMACSSRLAHGPWRPMAVCFESTALGLELPEMRPNVFLGGGPEGRRESIIDVIRDGLHGVATPRKSFDHLSLASTTMSEVMIEKRSRFSDLRAVRGKQALGPKRQDALEGGEVLTKIASLACFDHHAAALHDQVTGEHRSAWLVPERDVIRTVTGRVESHQFSISRMHPVAVKNRLPRN